MRRLCAGLSMLEVMIALGLLATVSLGAVQLLPSALAAQKQVEQREKATVAAGEVMEEMRWRDFTTLQSGNGQVVLGADSWVYAVNVTPESPSVKAVLVSVPSSAGTVLLETRIFGQAGALGQE